MAAIRIRVLLVRQIAGDIITAVNFYWLVSGWHQFRNRKRGTGRARINGVFTSEQYSPMLKSNKDALFTKVLIPVPPRHISNSLYTPVRSILLIVKADEGFISCSSSANVSPNLPFLLRWPVTKNETSVAAVIQSQKVTGQLKQSSKPKLT